MPEPDSDDRDLVVKDAAYFDDVRAALGRAAPTALVGTSSRTLDRGIARIAAAQTVRPQGDRVRIGAATQAPRARESQDRSFRYGYWLGGAVLCCVGVGLIVGGLVSHWFPAIFLVGTLLGVLTGGTVCARYLRQEIAANIGPRLGRIQNQLNNLETEINIELATRSAERGHAPQDQE